MRSTKGRPSLGLSTLEVLVELPAPRYPRTVHCQRQAQGRAGPVLYGLVQLLVVGMAAMTLTMRTQTTSRPGSPRVGHHWRPIRPPCGRTKGKPADEAISVSVLSLLSVSFREGQSGVVGRHHEVGGQHFIAGGSGASSASHVPPVAGPTIDWLATSSPGCPDPSRRPRGAEGATEGPIRRSKRHQWDLGGYGVPPFGLMRSDLPLVLRTSTIGGSPDVDQWSMFRGWRPGFWSWGSRTEEAQSAPPPPTGAAHSGTGPGPRHRLLSILSGPSGTAPNGGGPDRPAILGTSPVRRSPRDIHGPWTSAERVAVAAADEDAVGCRFQRVGFCITTRVPPAHPPMVDIRPTSGSCVRWRRCCGCRRSGDVPRSVEVPGTLELVRKSRPAERGTTIDWLATSSPGCPDPSRRPRGAEGATEGPIRGSKLQQRDFGSLSPRSGSLNPARPAAPVALPLNEGLSPAYVVAQSSASPSLAAVPRLDVVSRHSVGLSPIGRRYATPAGGSTLAH
jgi:hypothetical protein